MSTIERGQVHVTDATIVLGNVLLTAETAESGCSKIDSVNTREKCRK